MKDAKESSKEIFSEFKEFILREYPISATDDGDPRYDDKLTDSLESTKHLAIHVHSDTFMMQYYSMTPCLCIS
jgi:hypothetical protein